MQEHVKQAVLLVPFDQCYCRHNICFGSCFSERTLVCPYYSGLREEVPINSLTMSALWQIALHTKATKYYMNAFSILSNKWSKLQDEVEEVLIHPTYCLCDCMHG